MSKVVNLKKFKINHSNLGRAVYIAPAAGPLHLGLWEPASNHRRCLPPTGQYACGL